MRHNLSLRPPALTDQQAAVLGREAVLNRWRAQMLQHAAELIGAVLDEGGLPGRVHEDLLQALVACTWWQLTFAEKGGQ